MVSGCCELGKLCFLAATTHFVPLYGLFVAAALGSAVTFANHGGNLLDGSFPAWWKLLSIYSMCLFSYILGAVTTRLRCGTCISRMLSPCPNHLTDSKDDCDLSAIDIEGPKLEPNPASSQGPSQGPPPTPSPRAAQQSANVNGHAFKRPHDLEPLRERMQSSRNAESTTSMSPRHGEMPRSPKDGRKIRSAHSTEGKRSPRRSAGAPARLTDESSRSPRDEKRTRSLRDDKRNQSSLDGGTIHAHRAREDTLSDIPELPLKAMHIGEMGPEEVTRDYRGSIKRNASPRGGAVPPFPSRPSASHVVDVFHDSARVKTLMGAPPYELPHTPRRNNASPEGRSFVHSVKNLKPTESSPRREERRMSSTSTTTGDSGLEQSWTSSMHSHRGVQNGRKSRGAASERSGVHKTHSAGAGVRRPKQRRRINKESRVYSEQSRRTSSYRTDGGESSSGEVSSAPPHMKRGSPKPSARTSRSDDMIMYKNMLFMEDTAVIETYLGLDKEEQNEQSARKGGGGKARLHKELRKKNKNPGKAEPKDVEGKISSSSFKAWVKG